MGLMWPIYIINFVDKTDQPCLGFLGLYNIPIITELIMDLLWPIYIINFVDKTDHYMIPDTKNQNLSALNYCL